jgi:hypothetical protein
MAFGRATYAPASSFPARRRASNSDANRHSPRTSSRRPANASPPARRNAARPQLQCRSEYDFSARHLTYILLYCARRSTRETFMPQIDCFICHLALQPTTIGSNPDVYHTNCERCGSYQASEWVAAWLAERLPPEARPIFSEWTYEQNRLGEVPLITKDDIPLIHNRRKLSMMEKTRRFLVYLAEKTPNPGVAVGIRFLHIEALLQTCRQRPADAARRRATATLTSSGPSSRLSMPARNSDHWPSSGADTGTSTGRLMLAILGGRTGVQRDAKDANGRKSEGQDMGRPPALTPAQPYTAP